MIELSDIKDEITKTWNIAKKKSAFEFRAICTKYTGDANIDQHIQETIVRLKDYRDNGGLGNLYINTDPKPDFFDDSQTAIYHIGILSDYNLNLIANYYYGYFRKCFKELFEPDNKKTIEDLIYRCCYSFFINIQTVKRLSDLLDKVKDKTENQNTDSRFTYTMSEENTKELRRNLIEKHLIDESTKEDAFLYWFGYGKRPNNIKQINWVNVYNKDIQLFINTFFYTQNKKWDVAVTAFTIKGHIINKQTIQTSNKTLSNNSQYADLFSDWRKDLK